MKLLVKIIEIIEQMMKTVKSIMKILKPILNHDELEPELFQRTE